MAKPPVSTTAPPSPNPSKQTPRQQIIATIKTKKG